MFYIYIYYIVVIFPVTAMWVCVFRIDSSWKTAFVDMGFPGLGFSSWNCFFPEVGAI